MGSCIGKKEENRQTKKLKVLLPKNPLINENIIYDVMPFDQGDCIILNKNNFSEDYITENNKPKLITEFGIYQWCINKKTQERRLVKFIKRTKDPKSDEPLKINANIRIIKHLDHPNILKLLEYFEDIEYFYLVFEEYDSGYSITNMTHYICENEKVIAFIVHQILQVLAYLHSQNFILRTICPQNLFCDINFNIKIMELGGIEIYENKLFTQSMGLLEFQSPEMLNKKYNLKTDIWSVGVFLHLLLSGNLPFEGQTQESIQNSIKRGIFTLEEYDWEKVSINAKNLIKKLLTYNYIQRPTASEVLNDPFFQKAKNEKKQLKINQALINLKNFQKNEVLIEALIMQVVQMTLTNEQRTEIYHIFCELDTNNDGKISSQELLEGFQKHQNNNINLDENDIVSLVKKIDQNKNGYLDFTEFLIACQDKSKLLTVDKLKLVFQKLDIDNNKTLSMSEMRRIFGGNKISNENWQRILQKANLKNKTILNESQFLDFVAHYSEIIQS